MEIIFEDVLCGVRILIFHDRWFWMFDTCPFWLSLQCICNLRKYFILPTIVCICTMRSKPKVRYCLWMLCVIEHFDLLCSWNVAWQVGVGETKKNLQILRKQPIKLSAPYDASLILHVGVYDWSTSLYSTHLLHNFFHFSIARTGFLIFRWM